MNADGREWNLSQLLLADDTALLADSKGRLGQLVEESGSVCKRRKQKVKGSKRKVRVNKSKSKVVKCMMLVDGRRINVALNGEVLEELVCFKYLVSHVDVNGGIDGKLSLK